MRHRNGPGPVHTGPGPAHKAETERGSATAEFAVVLPCIVLLLAVVLGAGACAATSVRAEEAARLAARSLARGDPPAEAQRTAREIIGAEARIGVATSGDDATITVRTRAPGIIGAWGGLEITAEATTRVDSARADAAREAGP